MGGWLKAIPFGKPRFPTRIRTNVSLHHRNNGRCDPREACQACRSSPDESTVYWLRPRRLSVPITGDRTTHPHLRYGNVGGPGGN